MESLETVFWSFQTGIRNSKAVKPNAYLKGLGLDYSIKDINLDHGTIYIKRSAVLNKRTMELLPRLIILFSNYINATREILLQCKPERLIIAKEGKPISVRGIHAMIEPLKILFPDRALNPKTIRMSVICNWLNEKKISLERVQELAGHKWPGSTEKYIKVNSLH